MRLLLLQLSDIHVKGRSDWILTRASRIVDSVRDLEHRVDMCIVALTGDIAFSGTAEQYELASNWLESVVAGLQIAFGNAAIHVVAVPGNHDCNLSNPLAARTVLIQAMRSSPSLASDPATHGICLAAQTEFFDFRTRTASAGLTSPDRLYYEYDLSVTPPEAKPERVRVRCLNTSWVSQLHESIGTLLFPAELIAAAANGDHDHTIVVSLLHHPTNWMEPTNAREIRRALQNVSDVILTGHEHATGVRQQRDEAGGDALYVEGVALQRNDGSALESEFHAIVIDTVERTRRVVSLVWKSTRYEEERTPASAWAPFTENHLRAGHLFPLSEPMRAKLTDPGITLAHPTKGHLTLDDIFVYPDLVEIQYDTGNRQTNVVRGEDLLDVVLDAKRVVITGTDDSGKTTLAKRLFVDALGAGYVPLLVDGRSGPIAR